MISVLKWPVFGALFAGGVIAVAHYAGRQYATELGAAAGEGIAQGMAKAQAEIARTRGMYG